MKNKIAIIILFFSLNTFSQENLNTKIDSTVTRVFSFTPRSRIVSKVNGFAFGLGINSMFTDSNSIKQVNGLNVEINPIPLLVMFFVDPDKMYWTEDSDFILNGLNISTGNFNNAKINGLTISGLNVNHTNNGFSINGFYNYSKNLNGLHISGLVNFSESSNGLFVALLNDSENFNGLQIGVFNKSVNSNGLQIGVFNNTTKHIGIQIGLFNISKNKSGLQLGFWNINGKRSLPILNF